MIGVVLLRWLWLILALLGVACTAWGISTGQMDDVAVHASQLCLDCIGLSGH